MCMCMSMCMCMCMRSNAAWRRESSIRGALGQAGDIEVEDILGDEILDRHFAVLFPARDFLLLLTGAAAAA
jgi:hypothetical protein